MVSFNKKALSVEEQIELLINRGLIIEDRNSAISILKRVGYQMLNISNKRKVISYLGFDFDKKFMVTANWLFVVCVIRNICAHHARLFNRVFRITPTKQSLIKELNTDSRNTFYYIAMVINYYLRTLTEDISFEDDLKKLFAKYPNIDKTAIGFPLEQKCFTITPMRNRPVKIH